MVWPRLVWPGLARADLQGWLWPLAQAGVAQADVAQAGLALVCKADFSLGWIWLKPFSGPGWLWPRLDLAHAGLWPRLVSGWLD